MIKAAGRNDKTGRGVIFLGITKENVDALRAGMPIHIYADELGFNGEIVIHYGKNLERLRKDFEVFINPEQTIVRDTTGAKRN